MIEGAQDEALLLLRRMFVMTAEIHAAVVGSDGAWLSTSQFCALTGKSSATIRRWRDEHDELRALAPKVARGKPLRWHRDAVTWLRQRGLI